METEADDGGFSDATTEPNAKYGDMSDAIPDGNDLNRKKKSYPATADGDNPMAVETIKAALYAALTEKKAKPDFLDVDKDGDKKEPMKKALKDKGGNKPKKGVKPSFKKGVNPFESIEETYEDKKENCPECGKKGKVKLMACASCGCK